MNLLSNVSTWIETTMASGAAGIVDVGLKGAVVLTFAALMAHGLRRSSAAVRHLVWSTALAGLLALPVLSAVVPEWRVPAFASVTLPITDLGSEPVAEPMLPVADAVPLPETTASATTIPEPTVALSWARPEPPPRVAQVERRAAAVPSTTPTVAHEAGFDVASVAGALSPAAWLFVVWLTGALAVLAWVAMGSIATWWLARSAREVTGGPLLDLMDELSDELDIGAPVTLLESDSHSMPQTWGINPKVLLPTEAEEWTEQRLRAVLLHELAHIKRRDYLTQVLGHIAGAIHWFNPLVWYAARRMRVERERACDDRVLNNGSRASDYAEHLLDIARSMKVGGFASATSVAMARPSQLSDRLLDVLDATRRRTAVSPKMAGMVWALTALVVVPVAGMAAGTGTDIAAADTPAADGLLTVVDGSATDDFVTDADGSTSVADALRDIAGVDPRPTDYPRPYSTTQSRCDWYLSGDNTSTSIQSNDDELEITIKMDDCQLRIEAFGEIEFNDAETDVVYLSADGTFEIEEREGRTRRRLEIDSDRDGNIRHRWFVDGDEQTYGSAAQDWFASLLPLVFRRAGFNAEERALRILERDGVDGVLQEISYIPSDYVARKYFEVLLTQADLSGQQLREIVQQAGRELESDYELAELLIGVAENHPVDEAVQIAYVEAAGYIDSDYETRRVLNAVLDRPGLDQDVARAMLQLALEIESDYELAELLIGMMEQHPIEQTLTPEFFQAVETLESDYEHRRVLHAALERGAPNPEVLDLTLASASHLDSDYELAELLIQVGDLYPTDRAIPYSYLEASQSLDSDYERKRVMSVLIERGQLSDASLVELLGVVTLMDSDYELAETLVSVSDAYELSEATYGPFFGGVRVIDSDHDLSRVLKHLLEQQQPNDAMIEAVINASRSIGSDYELANVLIKVAETHRLNERLRTMYIETAEDIVSQYERDRVLAALVRHGGVQ
jgi:beta-lactamase regulating signal transducer with metallopeptidase domain